MGRRSRTERELLKRAVELLGWWRARRIYTFPGTGKLPPSPIRATGGSISSGVGGSTRGPSLALVDSPAADMDKASVIEFDDDISAFNGIVAVTTRDDRLPFHMVRVREDEEGPSATLSRGL